jgi:HlyD family secretion protein
MMRRSLLVTTALLGLAAVTPAVPQEAIQPAAAAQQAAAPAIGVVSADPRELVETLSVTGTVVAREEASVGTDLNGLQVTALNADQGDTVRKGDVLAMLDRTLLDTQLAQADAGRAQAEAAAAQVGAQIMDAEVMVRQYRTALERAQALQKRGVNTQAQLDDATNALDSANAKLEAARKALAASQAQIAVIDAQKQNTLAQIAKTEVRAPADGLVLSREATLGGVVSPSAPPMFRIAIRGEFELAADVAETELPRLAKGQPVAVRLGGLAEALGGTIRRISPEVNQQSRLGSIRVTLPASERARAGSFARGLVEISRRDGIAVPASAIVYAGDKAFLQVVEKEVIRTAPVVLGTRAGDWIEIVSGVAQGSEVVAKAGTFVADGDRVKPVREEITGAVTP